MFKFLTAFFFWRGLLYYGWQKMDFVSGRLYFIKDEFFDTVGEEYLKMNKEDTQRPHYYAFKDSSTGLLWVIPCSRQVGKYKTIIEKKEIW